MGVRQYPRLNFIFGGKNMSNLVYKHRVTFFTIVVISLTIVTGCKKPSIQTYTVPKNTAVPQVMPTQTKPAHIHWTVPNHWEVRPASSMRIGSFLTHGQNKQPIDISIVSLAGTAGGLTANINRWAGQLGLSPLSKTELATVTTTQKINSHTVTIVELTNNTTRLLTAIIPHKDTQYFIKVTGDNTAVKQEKRHFLNFVESISFDTP